MVHRSFARRAGSAGFASVLAIALGAPLAAGGTAKAAAAPAVDRSGAEARAADALVRTVEEFARAQQAFDAARLATLTTPDYLEVSPSGEVDSRDEMLGFYAPDRKSATPELAIDDVNVRLFGDAAVLIARIAYTMQAPGQPARTMEMRAGFVARRAAGDWKIASAQYTAIRPAAK